MTTTTFLAQLMGPIYLTVGVGFLLNQKFYSKVTKDFEKHDGLTYLSGIFVLLIGLLLVLSHTVWEFNAAGVITFIGYMATLKGLAILLAPKLFYQRLHFVLKSKNLITTAGIIALLLGFYLSYAGYLA